MIYYIDIPSRDTDGTHTVSAHAATENVLTQIGPVAREAIRIAETYNGVVVRTPGFRYSVAVTPDVDFVAVALAIVRQSGLKELTVGFRPNDTYSRITAEKIEEISAMQSRLLRELN